MGQIKYFDKEKLIIAVLFSKFNIRAVAKKNTNKSIVNSNGSQYSSNSGQAANTELIRIRQNMIVQILQQHFGPMDFISEILPFEYTTYYDEEMGGAIHRFFVSFRDLIAPDTLADIKTKTNSIEGSYAEDNRRKINLDPGLLALHRFILATTKDSSHRVPLRDGIYAEVTLRYIKKHYQALPWTYPDYRAPEYQNILLKMRTMLHAQLRQ